MSSCCNLFSASYYVEGKSNERLVGDRTVIKIVDDRTVTKLVSGKTVTKGVGDRIVT